MQRDAWRAGPLVHESVRNVADWRARLFPTLVLAVVGGAALASLSCLESAALQDQLSALRLDGRLVVAISSADPQQPVAISRASCEGLVDQPDVDRAGIVTAAGFYDVPQLGANVPVAAASTTLFPELTGATALVGSALRPPGADFHLTLPSGVALAHVMPVQPKGVDTNSGVVVALTPSTTSGPSCRVVLSTLASSAEAVPRVVAALQVVGSKPVTANSAFQDNIDPIHQYLTRTSRNLPLLLGVLGGFAAAVINRVRLSEFAAYRLSGTSGRSLGLQIALEQLLIGGVLASSTALAGAVAVGLLGYPASLSSIVLAGFAAAGVWVLVTALFTLDIPLRRPTDLAKDR